MHRGTLSSVGASRCYCNTTNNRNGMVDLPGRAGRTVALSGMTLKATYKQPAWSSEKGAEIWIPRADDKSESGTIIRKKTSAPLRRLTENLSPMGRGCQKSQQNIRLPRNRMENNIGAIPMSLHKSVGCPYLEHCVLLWSPSLSEGT